MLYEFEVKSIIKFYQYEEFNIKKRVSKNPLLLSNILLKSQSKNILKTAYYG